MINNYCCFLLLLLQIVLVITILLSTVVDATATTTTTKSNFVLQQQIIPQYTRNGGDRFGENIAYANNILVVSAHLDDLIDYNAGSAYIYQKNNVNTQEWIELQKIISSNGELGDWFGSSVAINYDGTNTIMAIGAQYDNNFDLFATGSVFIFKYDKITNLFAQIQILLNTQPLAQFGSSITLSNNLLIIGARNEDSYKGAVHIYKQRIYDDDHNTIKYEWIQKLSSPIGNVKDKFGATVTIETTNDGNTIIVVGAPGEPLMNHTGYVVIYTIDQQESDNNKPIIIKPIDGQIDDQFGRSIAIEKNILIIGNDKNVLYIYEYNENNKNWILIQKLINIPSSSIDIKNERIVSERIILERNKNTTLWEPIQIIQDISNNNNNNNTSLSVTIADSNTIIIGSRATNSESGIVHVYIDETNNNNNNNKENKSKSSSSTMLKCCSMVSISTILLVISSSILITTI